MLMEIGSTVVYPQQGPCRIGAVVEKVVAGNAISFYRLAVLDDRGDALLIPVDKVVELGLRHLVAKSEVRELLQLLGTVAPPAPANWKQRVLDNSKLLASGTALELTEIVRSLTALNDLKTLLPRDRQMLQQAKKHLVCEIAEVLGESRSAACDRVEKALEGSRQGKVLPRGCAGAA